MSAPLDDALPEDPVLPPKSEQNRLPGAYRFAVEHATGPNDEELPSAPILTGIFRPYAEGPDLIRLRSDEDQAWMNFTVEEYAAFQASFHGTADQSANTGATRHQVDPLSSQAPDVPLVTAAEQKLVSSALRAASSIAAGVRAHAANEWSAEQRAAEAGERRSAIGRLRFSLGLIRAALRIRGSRIADPFVDLLDRIIRSERRTWCCITLVIGALALYVFRVQGFVGVISDTGNLSKIGGGLYLGARLRRRVLKKRDTIAGVVSDGK